jgi:hypothetical protein
LFAPSKEEDVASLLFLWFFVVHTRMFHVKFVFVLRPIQKLHTSVCSGLLVLMSYWKQNTDLMWLPWYCVISTKK